MGWFPENGGIRLIKRIVNMTRGDNYNTSRLLGCTIFLGFSITISPRPFHKAILDIINSFTFILGALFQK